MKKMIELTPKQASEKIQQNNQVLFLDVRSCVVTSIQRAFTRAAN
jgi:hypothetical protein